MNKIFVMCSMFLLLFSVPAMATLSNQDLTSFNKLSEQDKAMIVQQIAARTPDAAVDRVEEMSRWVELGKGMGSAMIEMGKQLGVAGDEVLNSTTGKIGMLVILFSVMGRPMFGVFFILLSLVVWPVIGRRFMMETVVKTPPVPSNLKDAAERSIFLKAVQPVEIKQFPSSESHFFFIAILIVLEAAGVLMVIV